VRWAWACSAGHGHGAPCSSILRLWEVARPAQQGDGLLAVTRPLARYEHGSITALGYRDRRGTPKSVFRWTVAVVRFRPVAAAWPAPAVSRLLRRAALVGRPRTATAGGVGISVRRGASRKTTQACARLVRVTSQWRSVAPAKSLTQGFKLLPRSASAPSGVELRGAEAWASTYTAWRAPWWEFHLV
jgi:hypothetical protein